MSSKQTWIAGTEPPHDPVIEHAIDEWEEARVDQKRAAHVVKAKHAALVHHLTQAKLPAYVYADRNTGKKRTFSITKEPKVKTSFAAEPKKGRRGRKWDRSNLRDGDAELGDGVAEPKKDRNANKVESRRVPRASVAKEVDPFGETRDKMGKAEPAGAPTAGKKSRKPRAKKAKP